MRIDVSDCKTIPSKKDKIRTEFSKLLLQFLKENYEETEGDIVQIGRNEYAAVVAQTEDKDGFLSDICITIKPVVKAWTDSGPNAKRETEAFDRLPLVCSKNSNEALGLPISKFNFALTTSAASLTFLPLFSASSKACLV